MLPSFPHHAFPQLLSQGGNDHEIFADPRTIGHTVIDPPDTARILKAEFLPDYQ